MTEQWYTSVLEYGAIKDYALEMSGWPSGDDQFEDVFQKLTHPFGLRPPSTAHHQTHIYPSHVDDCKFLKSIGAEEFTHDMNWGQKTHPTHIIAIDDEHLGYYYEFYYSTLCTRDSLIFFKVKYGKHPKYITKNKGDFSLRLRREQEWIDAEHIL